MSQVVLGRVVDGAGNPVLDAANRQRLVEIAVDQNGVVRCRLVASNVMPPEQIGADFVLTGTGTALGQTSDLSAFGFPFRNIKAVKSAAVNTGTVWITVNGAGVATIKVSVSGGETVSITALIDGVNETDHLCVLTNAGVAQAATALASGTYFVKVR